MAKKKRKLLFVKWWSKLNSSAQAFVLLAGVFSAGFTAGMLFNNRNHSYEIIENNQRHNLDLKRQHDEFEEKLTDIKNQLDDCKQQYRLLEIDSRNGSHEK